MVAVRFGILLPDGTRLDEEAMRGELARVSEHVEDLPEAEGRLTIEHEGVTTDMGDALGPLIGAFCLDGLAALRSGGSYEVDFMDHEETVTLAQAGGEVTVTGKRFGERRYPEAAYLEAMGGCGQRYVALLREAWRDDPERREDLERVAKAAG